MNIGSETGVFGFGQDNGRANSNISFRVVPSNTMICILYKIDLIIYCMFCHRISIPILRDEYMNM